MLGSKKTTTTVSVSGSTTLISKDTVVKGDILFGGNLDVEGLVEGNIIADEGKEALVRVVDMGKVQGEIHAPTIVINGFVDGDVHSSRHLELAAKARVNGNVFYALVEMAIGAEVNGSLSHRDDVAGQNEMTLKVVEPTVAADASVKVD